MLQEMIGKAIFPLSAFLLAAATFVFLAGGRMPLPPQGAGLPREAESAVAAVHALGGKHPNGAGARFSAAGEPAAPPAAQRGPAGGGGAPPNAKGFMVGSPALAGAVGSQATREVPQSASPAGAAGAVFSYVEVEVPAGFRLPAAVLDSIPSGTAAQAEALDRISEHFLDTVASGEGEGPESGLPGAGSVEAEWGGALDQSNELYRSVFGIEAFNSWTSRSAHEALKGRAR